MAAHLNDRLYAERAAGGFTRDDHRVVFFAQVNVLATAVEPSARVPTVPVRVAEHTLVAARARSAVHDRATAATPPAPGTVRGGWEVP